MPDRVASRALSDVTDLMHSDDADDLFESSVSAEDETQPTADLPQEDAVGAVNDPDLTDAPDDEAPLEADDDPATLFADWEPPAPADERPRRRPRAAIAIVTGLVVLLALVLSAHHSKPSMRPAPAPEAVPGRSRHGRAPRHRPANHRRTHTSPTRPSKSRALHRLAPARTRTLATRHTSSSSPHASSPRASPTSTGSEFTNEFTP